MRQCAYGPFVPVQLARFQFDRGAGVPSQARSWAGNHQDRAYRSSDHRRALDECSRSSCGSPPRRLPMMILRAMAPERQHDRYAPARGNLGGSLSFASSISPGFQALSKNGWSGP